MHIKVEQYIALWEFPSPSELIVVGSSTGRTLLMGRETYDGLSPLCLGGQIRMIPDNPSTTSYEIATSPSYRVGDLFERPLDTFELNIRHIPIKVIRYSDGKRHLQGEAGWDSETNTWILKRTVLRPIKMTELGWRYAD